MPESRANWLRRSYQRQVAKTPTGLSAHCSLSSQSLLQHAARDWLRVSAHSRIEGRENLASGSIATVLLLLCFPRQTKSLMPIRWSTQSETLSLRPAGCSSIQALTGPDSLPSDCHPVRRSCMQQRGSGRCRRVRDPNPSAWLHRPAYFPPAGMPPDFGASESAEPAQLDERSDTGRGE